MRLPLVGMLLVSLPMLVFAQQGPVLRENPPPDGPVADTPSTDEPVTAAPLPPDDTPAPDQPSMVPNPLDEPDTDAPRAADRQAPQPQGQVQRGGWVQMGTASLQALDKINARAQTLTVKVGESAHFGSLVVAVRGCFVRTADRPADATALLVIKDQHAETPAFSGWMVRSDPSLSMMSNPVYDIRVTGCAP